MSTVLILGSTSLVLAFLAMFLFSGWRLRTIGFVLAGIAAGFLGVAVWFSHALERALERRNGPMHVFSLTEKTQWLAEEIALQMARETLLLDGLTNGEWHPVKDGRTASPDGRVDVYLARNSMNPLTGVLVFTNGVGNEAVVHLSIDSTNLMCQRVVHK